MTKMLLLSNRTIERTLAKLAEKQLIKRIGTKRDGSWILNDGIDDGIDDGIK